MAASFSNKMMLSSLPLTLIFFFLSSTTALQVTPGSSCASVCLDSPDGDSMRATNSSDMVCNDVDYFSSSTGQKFKACLTCLQTSNALSGEENDVSWFLYNLRYASAVCLYDYPDHKKTTTTPCDLTSACAPLQGALEYGNLGPENGTGYGYCQADDGVLYGTDIDDCVTCLQSSSSTYIANFLRALQAGCKEQPLPGAALSISGDVFSAFPINTTDAGNNTTSSSAASSRREDKPVLATGATVGIALGAAALFLGAIALFVVYCLKQKKYEREDKAAAAPFASAHQFYYSKDPGSGGPASVTTSNHSYVLPQYTADYKQPQVGAVSVSETPEPLPSEYSSNAEYYDRLEGRTRGRPLRTISPPIMQTAVVVDSSHQHQHEQVDTIGQLPTNSLPTHPAYIPRSGSRNSNHRGTPQPGARPSRNPTPTSVRSSTQSLRQQLNSIGGSGGKPDSYAIQVYLNAAEDPKVPQPPPPVAAPSWVSRPPSRIAPASNAEIARNIQIELASAQPTPPTSAGSLPQAGGRGTPAPPFRSSQQQQHISRTTSPEHTTGDAGGGSPLPPPPRIGSLILPSVPRIRVPGSKKLPPRLEVPDGAGAGISGPLAFPDGRFSIRPPPPPPPPKQGQGPGQDRIVTQTVDRGGRSVDVPIASGKSYLYG